MEYFLVTLNIRPTHYKCIPGSNNHNLFKVTFVVVMIQISKSKAVPNCER